MSSDHWILYTIRAQAEQEDAVAALLVDLGFAGVEVVPHGSQVELRAYARHAPGDHTLLRQVERMLSRVSAAFPHAPPPGIALTPFKDQEWAENWKQYFHPLRIGPCIVIRPSWTPYLPAPHERVIVLDPGRAFGTGQHHSTALCLESLQDRIPWQETESLPSVRRMLDVGTGSGILALAAARLGVETVLAVDIDPEAVAVARANVERNGLSHRIAVREGGPESVDGTFDLITANLDTRTLRRTLPHLQRLLAPRAVLIASGIHVLNGLNPEKDFAPLKILRRRRREEWLCLELSAT